MSDQGEVTSEELPDRAKTVWIMEVDRESPLADAAQDASEDTEEEREPAWMGIGALYDDRKRALSTLAFHERKHGPGRQQLVRVENRHYVERVTPEELQEFHDQAAAGDAEKAAQG